MLPDAIKAIVNEHGVDYSTALEMRRPRLPMGLRPGSRSETDLLGNLSVSMVKELCESYFSTFHLTYPMMDRTFFLRHTLSAAIKGEFGYDIESCVVLAVMALGCWSKRALGEFHEYRTQGHRKLSGSDMDYEYMGPGAEAGIPGLAFFNESRKRIGWLINDNDMQSCQYYLLSRYFPIALPASTCSESTASLTLYSMFYAQLVRPVDWWTMANRASTCCRMFWEK
jgi:hypothetical protein